MKLVSRTEKAYAGAMAPPEIEQAPAPPEHAAVKKAKRPRKKRSKKWIFILALVLAAVGFLLYTLSKIRNNMPNLVDSLYTHTEVERRDITSALTGSGTLEPADSYTVTTLVSGEILSARFDEGSVIAKGHVLYEIDSSDKANTIERAENSLEQSQRSYNRKVSSLADLTIYSGIGGNVTGLNARVGDTIGMNAPVATIEDTSSLTLTEYYSDEYAGHIYAGMPAMVSIPGEMLNLEGHVREVSSLKRTSETGISCFAVTVEVANVGSLTPGTTATCWLMTGGAEDIYPSISDDNGLDVVNRTTIYAGVSGTVTEILVRNSETIAAGQLIMTLSSNTLSDEVLNSADALRDAELSLQSQYDSLENYTITAPIEGTIVDKYYKEGETAEVGRTLCTIYDLSSLTFVMNVDELDISQVEVGQRATITAQAVPGVEYDGIITKVGINGTAVNGVTTYPVTVRIDRTDGLLPGMNVDVSVIVREGTDLPSLPVAAVLRGGRVLTKTTDGTTGEGAPEGYDYVEVVTGISDDDYVEIVSGLQVGAAVAYIPEMASGTDLFRAMAMGGGMGGGGVVRSETTIVSGPAGSAR